MRICAVLLGVVFTAAVATARAEDAANDAPTLDDVKRRFDAGEYRAALRDIAKAMPPRGRGAGAGGDRYALLMYKGECLLRLKEKSFAVDAFDDAARAATGRADVAAAMAMATLVRASRGTSYTPGPGGKPIDILEPESRERAMLILSETELEGLQRNIDRAMSGSTLPPIHELLDPMIEVFSLELAATGGDARTRPVLEKLGGHARDLIAKELVRVTDLVEQVNASANELVVDEHLREDEDELVRRGLTNPQRRELKEAGDYVDQIAASARTGRRVAIALGGAREKWEALLAEADALAERTAEVRDRRY